MKKTKLKDVASLFAGYPFDGHLYDIEGIRVVRGDNVTIGSLRWDIDKRWNLPFKETEIYSLRQEDIVIGMDGSRVGRNRAMVSKKDLPLYLAQRVACVRSKKISYQKFLYYAIFNTRFEQYINTIHTGTSIPHISLEQLGDYSFPLPELNLQIKIGDFLFLLDQKISLNTRMNAELEAMAKQIYDYWFVQFDFPDENGNPYKSSGGEMVYNSTLKREIPAGWEVSSIGELISTERGISYSTPNISSGNGVPMLNLATFMPGGGDYKASGLKHYLGDYSPSKVLKPYDLIMCNTQQTAIKFETDIIGRAMLVPDIFEDDIVFSHHVNIIKTEDDDLKYYLLYLFNSDYFHKYISGYTNGTNILGLSFNGVTEYNLEIPPASILEQFASLILDIAMKKSLIFKESSNLTHLRDSLLPMLMNGQVTVE